MTYPDNPTGLQSVGFFTNEGRDADKLRERLVGIGMEWFHKCQNERIRQERQWYLNYAFYSGNQYVKFRQTQSGGPFDMYTPKAPGYRVRLVVNQVRKIVRKEVSRLTAQKPNAYVIPASTEDADVFAAQAAEQIWDYLWRKVNFNKILREAIFWQAVCGNGFIKSQWDANKEDPDQDPDRGIIGDISIFSVSPFHLFFPDLMCSDIEDQPYVIHAMERTNTWIMQNFGIDSTSNNIKVESVEEGMQNMMGVTKNDSKKDVSTILEIWVKPGYLPEMPQGGMFTIAGDQLVQGFDVWPYEHRQYPFTKLDGMPTGKFYNASNVEDLIPLQQELNRTRSQLIESKNRMTKPQLVAEKGTVDPRKITSEPGLVIEYAVGFQPPQPLPLQGLPSYVTEEIDRLYTDLADLSGQHEVSNGSTPPGVTAATAISFLQEQDESLIATHYTSLEEGIQKVAAQALDYVKTYWDEERTVKIVGIEGTFDVQTFKNADLRGNTDIRVEAGSALPQSRAAKQAFIMDLMKMGFIPPDKGLEIMEIGGLNRLYEGIQVDKRQAQRENMKMRVIKEEDIKAQQEEWVQSNPEVQKDIDGGMKLIPPLIVPTHTYDNHAVHIEMHNNYRKSQNFEGADPVTKALFEEHVRQHMEAQANMMVHPMTGMMPSDPNAPNPDDEEAAQQQMEQDDQGGEGQTGPVPMPDLSSDTGGA